MKTAYESEQNAWNSFYDALDRLENALAADDPAALETGTNFKTILSDCRIS